MIKEYLNYLVTLRGYSTNTATAYRKDLAHFVAWIQQEQPSARWSTITRADIDKYVTSMVRDGLKPATTNRHLAAISGLYKFMKREGLEVTNPCQYESRRKLAATLPNTIPTEDLLTAYDHAYGIAKVMLGLLATTGMRIQELLDMTWENINYETGAIRVTGKGNKQRIVYTTRDKLETLAMVATYSQQHTGRIFTIEQRAARYLIWQALKPYSSAPQLSPHAIRHSVATHMAVNGANATTIGQALGHNDLRTTQKYIDMSQCNTMEAFSKYNMFN